MIPESWQQVEKCLKDREWLVQYLPRRHLLYCFPYFFPRSWQALAYGSGIINRTTLLAWIQLPFLLINFFFTALKSARKTQLVRPLHGGQVSRRHFFDSIQLNSILESNLIVVS